MEFVINDGRQCCNDDTNNLVDVLSTEAVVDGCHVKICSSAIDDRKVLVAIQSILTSVL